MCVQYHALNTLHVQCPFMREHVGRPEHARAEDTNNAKRRFLLLLCCGGQQQVQVLLQAIILQLLTMTTAPELTCLPVQLSILRMKSCSLPLHKQAVQRLHTSLCCRDDERQRHKQTEQDDADSQGQAEADDDSGSQLAVNTLFYGVRGQQVCCQCVTTESMCVRGHAQALLCTFWIAGHCCIASR